MSNKVERELTPKLRFPEFQDAPGWGEKKLSDACAINPSNRELPESFVYIDLESVVAGKLIYKKKIYRDDAPSRAQRLLKNGDVIYQVVRPYQRNNFFFEFDDENAYVASTGYAQLRSFDVSKFLYQLIHTDAFVNKVIAQCTGSNYPAINSSDLAEITVAIPKAPEQQKIADCLSSIDDTITAQTQKLDTLKTHKKGLLQQLFPAEGESVPRLRFPEFQDASAWDERQLSKLTTKISDGIHSTPVYVENGEYAFINGNNLVNGKIVIDEKTKRVNLAEFNKHKNPLDANSILMSINGTIGNLAIFRDEKVILGKSACFINVDKKLVHTLFIYYMLQTDKVKDVFDTALTGSTIKNLSLGTIKNTQLLIPALPEQQKIADCLTSIDDLISAQSQKLEALKIHKKALMQQLFPAAGA